MTGQYCLKWNNYQSSVTRAFKSLREEDDFVDVTLSAAGKNLRAHKVVLSACSPYFRDVLKDIGQWQHAVLVLKDVSWLDLQYILEFVYVGQVNVAQENLQTFLKTAELLKIRGLTEDMGGTERNITERVVGGDTSTQSQEQDPRNLPPSLQQLNPFSSPASASQIKTSQPHRNRLKHDNENSTNKKRKKSKDVITDDAQNVPDNELNNDMKQEPLEDQEQSVEEKTAVSSSNERDEFAGGGGSPVDPSQFVKMDMDELDAEDAAKGLVIRHDLLTLFGERGRCHFCSLLCSDRDALTVHLKTAHQPAKHALCENCENFFHVCAIQRHRMKCHIRYVSDK